MRTQKRILYEYEKGELITRRKPETTLCTLAIPPQDPYKVLKYHVNGSITTILEPNFTGRVNIRHFHPYYRLLEKIYKEMMMIENLTHQYGS